MEIINYLLSNLYWGCYINIIASLTSIQYSFCAECLIMSTPATIESPHYPRRYDDREDICWIVSAPTGLVNQLTL